MGLFRKDPAEKKLKELTGGFLLNSSFLDRLKKAGLTAADGTEIQREIKESIKRGEVKAEGIETRLNYLIEQKKSEKLGFKSSHEDLTKNPRFTGDNRKSKPVRASSSADHTRNPRYMGDNGKSKPVRASSSADHTKNPRYMGDNKRSSGNKVKNNSDEIEVLTADSLENMAKDDRVKEMKFLLNQDHNLKECPKCHAKILQYDKYCFRCGCEVRQALFEIDSQKSEISPKREAESKSTADELSELVQKYNEETNSTTDELSVLEKLYSKKVSSKYSPKFKFALVLYLSEINKNPNKSINANYYQANYDSNLVKIKKQAKEDEFIGEGSPLIAAKSATVKDLKKLLKEHDLMVSGTKAELIERLGENLSEDELKKAFPKKVLSVTDNGLEFIENNKYVLYYDKSSPIRTHLEVDEYDSIFVGVDDLSEENIHKLLIDYLEKRGNELVDKKKWAEYRYNFMVLARVYKDSGIDLKVLDNDFKLFIAGINNFNDYTNQSEPAYGYIGKTYSNELIDLLHSLSLSIDELKDKFGQSYDDLKYPNLKISKEESLVYLLKLFSGEDAQDLTNEIRSKYPDPNMRFSY